MAILIAVDGTERTVLPNDRKKGFTLQELYDLVSCSTVELITLIDGRKMLLDEDGKAKQLQRNERATALLHEAGGMPHDFVGGTVLICSGKELR